MMPYRYLVRLPGGRGLSCAHLVDDRGEAVCGKRLGDRWHLATTTQRRVCSRCRAILLVSNNVSSERREHDGRHAQAHRAGNLGAGVD